VSTCKFASRSAGVLRANSSRIKTVSARACSDPCPKRTQTDLVQNGRTGETFVHKLLLTLFSLPILGNRITVTIIQLISQKYREYGFERR
jgi:hypothetical protein